MSPELEIQGLIVNRLKADPTLTTLINGRVYDSIPQSAPFPYVSYGPVDANEDDADCITGFEVFIQLDAWSRTPGFPEVHKITDAVRASLHDASVQISTNALVFLEHRQTRTFRDPDGLTSHAAISFEASVERK
jgi:hypothetical protein